MPSRKPFTLEDLPIVATETIGSFTSQLSALPPPVLALTAFAVGSISTLGTTLVYRRFFRRLRTGEWVTPDVLAKKRWIKGKVISVGDNDNFRIYHTPGLGWKWPLKFRWIPTSKPALKGQTIHIRMAGIDAPEAAHFGKPAQAYSDESLAWLKNQVEGKFVYCQLFRRDQYGRVVAMPYLAPRLLPAFLFGGKCVPVEMLKAGWAMTYEQAGAEYGKYSKEEFLKIQSEAQVAKLGIWQKGTSFETPAQYKKRYAGSIEQAEAASEEKSDPSGTPTSWWRRLWSRP